MAVNRHIIRNQAIEVHCSDEADARELQDVISRIYREEVAPELERMFGEWVDTEALIRLDVIEVETLRIRRGQLERDLKSQLLQAIEKAVAPHIRQLRAAPPGSQRTGPGTRMESQGDLLLFYLEHGHAPWWGELGDRASWEPALLDRLQHTSGYPARLRALLADKPQAIRRLVYQASDSFLADLMRKFLPDFRPAWLPFHAGSWRLVKQFSSPSMLAQNFRNELAINALTACVSGKDQGPQPQRAGAILLVTLRTQVDGVVLPGLLIRGIAAAAERQEKEKTQDAATWLAMLQAAQALQSRQTRARTIEQRDRTAARGRTDLPDADGRVERGEGETTTQSSRESADESSFMEAGTRPEKRIREGDAHEIEVKKTDDPETPQAEGAELSHRERADVPEDRLGDDPVSFTEKETKSPRKWPESESFNDTRAENMSHTESGADERNTGPETRKTPDPATSNTAPPGKKEQAGAGIPRRRPRKTEAWESAEGIYLENAGIVLLHPFLPAMFEGLQLTVKGAFVDEPARTAAIYLMHYLATGRLLPAEHELALYKVLCDLPVSEAIEGPPVLPPEWLAEAQDLLQAAIGHWKALKNTSSEGLREGFLQRDGKLSRRKNGDLLLQVEQKTVDILLRQLPWGLSLVRFPWMQEILYVEWG